jgi:hypothetical protein
VVQTVRQLAPGMALEATLADGSADLTVAATHPLVRPAGD